MSKQNLNLTFLIQANRPFAAVLLIGVIVGGLTFTLAAYLLASIGDTLVAKTSMVDQVFLQKLVLFEVGAVVGAMIAISLLVQYWNRIWAGFLAKDN